MQPDAADLDPLHDVEGLPVFDEPTTTDADLLAQAGVDPIFSTTEAAEFFDRSTQWVYWGLRKKVFVDDDETPIDPDRIGNPVTGRRRFTVPILKNMLVSSYRRGNVDQEGLKLILRRIHYAEHGVDWREKEGWRQIQIGKKRTRWVRPDKARWNKRLDRWVLKK